MADNILVNEVQLLLAEKRTALASLRAGIAVLVLPLSALSLLVTTSRLYSLQEVIGWLIPLLAILTALLLVGGYLIVHGLHRARHCDRLIREIKLKHSAIAHLM